MSREIEDAHKRLADKDREVERLLRSPHSSRDDRPSRSATLTKSRSLDADEQVGYNAQNYRGQKQPMVPSYYTTAGKGPARRKLVTCDFDLRRMFNPQQRTPPSGLFPCNPVVLIVSNYPRLPLFNFHILLASYFITISLILEGSEVL